MLPASERVEYYNANTVFKYWNGIVPGYIHEMLKFSLCGYSARSQMALDLTLRKWNTVQNGLPFLEPKLWSKVNSSIKNFKTTSFKHALKKSVLLHMQT